MTVLEKDWSSVLLQLQYLQLQSMSSICRCYPTLSSEGEGRDNRRLDRSAYMQPSCVGNVQECMQHCIIIQHSDSWNAGGDAACRKRIKLEEGQLLIYTDKHKLTHCCCPKNASFYILHASSSLVFHLKPDLSFVNMCVRGGKPHGTVWLILLSPVLSSACVTAVHHSSLDHRLGGTSRWLPRLCVHINHAKLVKQSKSRLPSWEVTVSFAYSPWTTTVCSEVCDAPQMPKF